MRELRTVRVAAIQATPVILDAEGILTAECDLRVGLHAKRWFDVAGHYSRADVLLPLPTLPGPSHRVAGSVTTGRRAT